MKPDLKSEHSKDAHAEIDLVDPSLQTPLIVGKENNQGDLIGIS